VVWNYKGYYFIINTINLEIREFSKYFGGVALLKKYTADFGFRL